LFFTHKEYQLMKNRLTKNQLEKLVREQLTDEVRQQIDEGIWDSIKYGLGKLGSLEGGKGIGKVLNPKAARRRVAAKEKLEAALEKESKKKVKDLVDALKKEYETMDEFPNMKDQFEFQAVLAHFTAFYDSLKAATEKYDYSKGPEDQPEGAMHADAANELVQVLNQYVLYQLDDNLDDVYKHFKENLEEEGQTLAEMIAEQEEGEEGEEDFTQKQSRTMEGLQAKALENTLIALGGVFVAAHFIAMQTVTETMEVVGTSRQSVSGGYTGVIEETHTKVVENAASSVSGKGTGGLQAAVQRAGENSGVPGMGARQDLVENMRAIANHSNSSIEEVVSGVGGTLKHPLGERTLAVIADLDSEGVAVGEIIRSGNVSEDILTRITELDGEVGAAMRELGAGAAQGGGTASPLNSLLDISHDKFTIAGKMVTEKVVPIGAQMFQTYALKAAGTSAVVAATTTFPALGGILLPIGVALAASGLSIKLLRAKGRKSSRAADLKAAKDYMKLFEPGVPVLDPKPEEGGEEGPVETPFPVLEESDNICKSMVSAMRAYKFKVGDTFDFQTQGGEQKTAMIISAEGMPTLVDNYQEIGEIEVANYEHDYESSCAKRNGRFIYLPQVIVFNEGDVQRKVSEKVQKKGPKLTKKTNQAEQMSMNQVGVRVVKKGGNPFATMTTNSGKKLGLEPTGALPEGYVIQFNVGNIQRSDGNFESFLKKYVSALRGADKEQRAKAFMDVLAPELRRRRGMSDEKPKDDKPQADEPQADEPQADEPKKSDDSGLSLGAGGIEFGKAPKSAFGKKKKVRPPTDAGTMRRRKKTRGGRALEETTEINETLARWKKIAGIIKESKND
jgi:hypothetical protein